MTRITAKRSSSSSNFLGYFLKGQNVVYLLILLAFWVFAMNNPMSSSLLTDAGAAQTRGLQISNELPPQIRATTQVCGAAVLEHVWTQDTTLDAPVLNPACPQPKMMMEPVPVKPDKVVTFFIIYYNNVDYLAQQIDSWIAFSETAKKRTQFLIVDDGSTIGYRAVDFLNANPAIIAAGNLDIQVYEVDQDLVWNIGGARNLGFWVAPTEWVFLSDSDIVVRSPTMDYVLELYDRSTPQTIFKNFHRRRADRKTFKPHPAVMLIGKKSYWKAGACDEDFIGNYGYTDVHFFHRAESMKGSLKIEYIEREMKDNRIPPVEELPDQVICPIDLKCLTTYQGVKPIKDAGINAKLMKQKIRGRVPWAKDYMRFTWRRVW